MKAPPEPGLAQLTPPVIELLLEKYVRWSVHKKNNSYFGALPRPFIDGLREYSPSRIPVVRAINTAPLVTSAGRVISGVGLDRNTGLVHRIDPLLHECVPADPPTEQDVGGALNFLMNEWLVDVALNDVGKCLAIMLALSLIERPLLPERPAFFITAGLRGGGKTTLVHMLTSAVLGRKAAAASWSKNPEERKKALFSYFREGIAALAWDNIARGSAISCPHIEAALTASETSDRVLGVSRVDVVPANTIQMFTGNSIMPRGDMASRAFTLALNVNRPDPENREFTHPDPVAWTRCNRTRILRALYTILIAGALNRPQDQVSKTRFKTWWRLVGWPVEYAASLMGIMVDCTDLLRAGEVGDDEAAAVALTLGLFREIWGDKHFTAKDVVKKIAPQPDGLLDERAEAIADALGELVGKRLDRPTAHGLGKLFQKRLVDRPAWIDDGQRVGTLKKFTGHNENSYRVDITNPGPVCDLPSRSTVSDVRENIPRIPQIPHPADSEESAEGNEGKDGNVFVDSAAQNGLVSDDQKDAGQAWSTRL